MNDAEWLVSRSYMLSKAQAHIGKVSAASAETLSTRTGLITPMAKAFPVCMFFYHPLI
jgi:hypothetical protein